MFWQGTSHLRSFSELTSAQKQRSRPPPHGEQSCLCWSITVGGGGGDLVTKSCLTLAAPWTVACQAPLSIGFSRQEHWCGLLVPSPEDLPDPGIEPGSPALQADSLLSEPPRKPLNLLGRR